MCGVFGIFGRPIPDQTALESIMKKTLSHRGPDNHGIYINHEKNIFLGHERLSIIDLEGGNQPISNEKESVWVICNGEIYNFRELRESLQRKGHFFKTRVDTEVIVHLYEEYGDGFFTHLKGMFACALWDEQKEILLLGRDRFGEKPLFYSVCEGNISFASEIQSLLSLPFISKKVNWNQLDNYFKYLTIPSPDTIFEHIVKLRPGHYVKIEGGGEEKRISENRYWELLFEPKSNLSFKAAKETFYQLMKKAVRSCEVSDVPLGVFLSGGMDSSSIVGLMSSKHVKSFSIGFREEPYNELQDARLVARHFNTDHHEEIITESMVQDILPELVRHFGEPFADSSAVAGYYVSKLARSFVTVALCGDGMDEVLGGYSRHWDIHQCSIVEKVPKRFRKLLNGIEIKEQDDTNFFLHRWFYKYLRLNRLSFLPQFERFKLLFEAGLSDPLKNILSFSIKGASQTLKSTFDEASSLKYPFEMASYTDLHFYMPNDLLPKVDITSMIHSLECRCPFLDYELVEFAATLPVQYKYRLRNSKYILKQAMKGILPESIIKKPKHGFAIPIDSWFKNSLGFFFEEAIHDDTSGLINKKEAFQLLKHHRESQGHFAHQLWMILVLVVWAKEFDINL